MAPKLYFWHKVWCGDQALMIDFSELVQFCTFKEGAVVDHLEL